MRGNSPDAKSVHYGDDDGGKNDRAKFGVTLDQALHAEDDDIYGDEDDDENAGDINKHDFMERQKAAEAEEELEKQAAAEHMEEEAKEREMQKFFVELDADGNYKPFDRKKKYGEILNEEQLIYEPPEELEEVIERLY